MELTQPGEYTAFLDPDSSAVYALRNADGERVDFALPAADAASKPATNAPAGGGR